MKTQELRIGNYVSDKVSGTLLKVDYISKESFGVYVLDRSKYPLPEGWEAEPIPLTEQWLIDFGFVKYDNGCVSATFCIGKNPITYEHILELIWLKDYTDENFEPYPFYKNAHFMIKSVHQLQNLYFALTGEELIKK